jgi:hypothetical protein
MAAAPHFGVFVLRDSQNCPTRWAEGGAQATVEPPHIATLNGIVRACWPDDAGSARHAKRSGDHEATQVARCSPPTALEQRRLLSTVPRMFWRRKLRFRGYLLLCGAATWLMVPSSLCASVLSRAYNAARIATPHTFVKLSSRCAVKRSPQVKCGSNYPPVTSRRDRQYETCDQQQRLAAVRRYDIWTPTDEAFDRITASPHGCSGPVAIKHRRRDASGSRHGLDVTRSRPGPVRVMHPPGEDRGSCDTKGSVPLRSTGRRAARWFTSTFARTHDGFISVRCAFSI